MWWLALAFVLIGFVALGIVAHHQKLLFVSGNNAEHASILPRHRQDEFNSNSNALGYSTPLLPTPEPEMRERRHNYATVDNSLIGAARAQRLFVENEYRQNRTPNNFRSFL